MSRRRVTTYEPRLSFGKTSRALGRARKETKKKKRGPGGGRRALERASLWHIHIYASFPRSPLPSPLVAFDAHAPAPCLYPHTQTGSSRESLHTRGTFSPVPA